MSALPSREACLATVMKSPAAVAMHDKEAWMSIFARYNIVEDPIGSTPQVSGLFDVRSGVRGKGPLSRFYDCFIAPNGIRFHVDQDLVCGFHVLRDINMEVTLSPQVVLKVPMHALYELVDEDGELKVLHLSAHWELWPMLKQQMSFGLASLGVGLALGRRMLRELGWRDTLAFMGAMRNIGAPGKASVQRFVAAFNARDFAAMHAELASSFSGVCWPAQACASDLEQLRALEGELVLGKTLAAGNYITASFTLNGAGREQPLSGVLFFEFNMQEQKLQHVRAYVEA